MNEYEKKYSYDVPVSLLKDAISELKVITYIDLKDRVDLLINEIETVLLPAHESVLSDMNSRQQKLNEAFQLDVVSHYREIDAQEERRKQAERQYERMLKQGGFKGSSSVLFGSDYDWPDLNKTVHGMGDRPDPNSERTQVVCESVLIAVYENGMVLLRNDKTFYVGASLIREVARWRRGDNIVVATAYNRYGARFGFWLKNVTLNVMVFAR